MLIRVPRSSKVYVFGSILYSKKPNDLDVLVIYDPEIHCPSKAYVSHKELILHLEICYGLPVHITMLTPSEELGTDFIRRTGAVEIAEAMKRNLLLHPAV